MNQRVLYNFELIVNEKYYEFACQPGTTFDEIEAAFVELKKEFDALREQALQAEADAKAQSEPSETSSVEAELVS